jgi:hypothetical protein
LRAAAAAAAACLEEVEAQPEGVGVDHPSLVEVHLEQGDTRQTEIPRGFRVLHGREGEWNAGVEGRTPGTDKGSTLRHIPDTQRMYSSV